MVWGMGLPKTFGEFWPDGEFEYDPKEKESRWPDRLRLHYLAQTPEEQVRLLDYRGLGDGRNTIGWAAGQYSHSAWSKFKRELGTKDGPDALPVTPAEAHEAPLTFDTEKVIEKLGSLIMLNGKILAVDDVLKGIIERLEPSAHQFFPIEIRMPKGQIFEKKYYTIVVRQWFDSYMPEQSDRSKKNFSGLFFSKQAFGGAHLWKDRSMPDLIYFSGEMKGEIDKAGLRLPNHYRVKVV